MVLAWFDLGYILLPPRFHHLLLEVCFRLIKKVPKYFTCERAVTFKTGLEFRPLSLAKTS